MKNTDRTGRVFDIKRFATHDGEGIRTTIFLKGCPLRCKWCQNPEGLSLKPQVMFFANKCIGCKTCVSLSKNNGMVVKNGKAAIRKDQNEDWNLLIDECPTEALTWDSREYTIDRLLEEVLKDQPFFKYGGGVTISGGEPFAQPEFLQELLKKLKQESVHTTIETSLMVDHGILKKALPYIDHIYVDLKLYDPDLHFQYTGVDNKQIKSNLIYLLNSFGSQHITVRTPLIPGMTATEENLSKIGRFLKDCHNEVRYELLNYNPLAKSKYHLVDMEYCFLDNPPLYTNEEMKEFRDIIWDTGITNIIIDQ